MPKRIKKISSPDNLVSLATTPKLTKSSRRRFTRGGIITGNLILLIAVGAFVLHNRSASQTVINSTANSISTASSSLPNPLDQLSSDQIAYQVAQMTKLPEATLARNRADSATVLLAVVSNDNTALAKPQIVSTAQKSRLDIIQYRVKKGDSVESLSRKFHVSGNSIRWSNDLNGDSLTVGSIVNIPPGEGIVYKVAATDNINSIVNRFQANRNTFITVNDAENGNLRVGELVWIPNATQPIAVAAPTYTTQALNFNPSHTGAYTYTGPCIPNGYDCGWCTWWAAYRWNQWHHPRQLPHDLGDAISWAYAGAQRGLTVSIRPQAGAVIWYNRNHVGFVESKKNNGDIVVSDMNAVGWNVVSTSVIPASQVENYKYIY